MALDPDYSTKKTRELVYGGAAGQVLLNSRVRCPSLQTGFRDMSRLVWHVSD